MNVLHGLAVALVVYWLYSLRVAVRARARRRRYALEQRRRAGIPDADRRPFAQAAADAARQRLHRQQLRAELDRRQQQRRATADAGRADIQEASPGFHDGEILSSPGGIPSSRLGPRRSAPWRDAFPRARGYSAYAQSDASVSAKRARDEDSDFEFAWDVRHHSRPRQDDGSEVLGGASSETASYALREEEMAEVVDDWDEVTDELDMEDIVVDREDDNNDDASDVHVSSRPSKRGADSPESSQLKDTTGGFTSAKRLRGAEAAGARSVDGRGRWAPDDIAGAAVTPARRPAPASRATSSSTSPQAPPRKRAYSPSSPYRPSTLAARYVPSASSASSSYSTAAGSHDGRPGGHSPTRVKRRADTSHDHEVGSEWTDAGDGGQWRMFEDGVARRFVSQQGWIDEAQWERIRPVADPRGAAGGKSAAPQAERAGVVAGRRIVRPRKVRDVDALFGPPLTSLRHSSSLASLSPSRAASPLSQRSDDVSIDGRRRSSSTTPRPPAVVPSSPRISLGAAHRQPRLSSSPRGVLLDRAAKARREEAILGALRQAKDVQRAGVDVGSQRVGATSSASDAGASSARAGGNEVHGKLAIANPPTSGGAGASFGGFGGGTASAASLAPSTGGEKATTTASVGGKPANDGFSFGSSSASAAPSSASPSANPSKLQPHAATSKAANPPALFSFANGTASLAPPPAPGPSTASNANQTAAAPSHSSIATANETRATQSAAANKPSTFSFGAPPPAAAIPPAAAAAVAAAAAPTASASAASPLQPPRQPSDSSGPTATPGVAGSATPKTLEPKFSFGAAAPAVVR